MKLALMILISVSAGAWAVEKTVELMNHASAVMAPYQ